MTPDELAEICERVADGDLWLSDAEGLLAEVDRLDQVRVRLQALEQAERDAIPGASRAEKVGHKAAAEAYSIAGALLDGDPSNRPRSEPTKGA